MKIEKQYEGALQIIITIIIVIAAFYISTNLEWLGNYSYLGAFVISIISSATVLLPAPGMIIIFGMSRFLDPLSLGIAAGIGSAIGELTGFFAGNGIRNILKDKIKETQNVKELISKYDIFAIIILSAIPNPIFDIAGILAGAAKMPWWRFLIGCAIGRVIRYSLIGFVGEAVL
jgi:membrane protein YqaA with SNARE-associated domain